MATYAIEWKKSAVRELRRIDRDEVVRIVSAVESLAHDARPDGARKLQGSQHTYRIRVGDYRVVYDVSDAKLLIQVVRTRHRKDVYRR
jgi:mRNA interferase RelE/StbE